LFWCGVCKKPVFRAGKNVARSKQLCGKHGNLKQEIDLPQIERKPAQEPLISGEPGSVVAYNLKRLEWNRRKLNKVEELIPKYTQLTFPDLWSMAARELGEQEQ